MGIRIRDIVEPLQAEVLVEGDMENRELKGGYCGDLLSDCIANAEEGSIWVTIQSHPNVVAVASLVGIPCIVVSGNQDVQEQTLEKAKEQGITILRTHFSSFQAVAILAKLGIPGTKRHALQ
ncbi:MAG: DRTGG domain-containing protein [Candidatus Caldatribacteriaceae bacterium]